MKKLTVILCTLCLLASVAMAADSWTGVITDKSCATKPSASNADCAKKCIERDNAAVFVNDKDKSVVPIHNVDAIKGHECHHVKVTGSMTDNAIHVDKVEMVADKGAKKEEGKK